MSFADNLKMIRKEKGLTQEQLAEILGVSRQAVSKWESNNGYPETDKLIVIAKEFGVSLDYLILGKPSNGLPKETDVAQLKSTIAELVERLEQFKTFL